MSGKGLLNSQNSYTCDAILTTNYIDNNIVQGNVFSIAISQALTAATPLYFTAEYTDVSVISKAFLLPISINPTEGYVTLNIYEGTDYDGGNAVTPANRNRVSGIDPLITIKSGATGSDKGTLLFTIVYGSAASGGFFGGSSGGGAGSTANSIVLDTSKAYLFELTSSETATVGIEAEFAELRP